MEETYSAKKIIIFIAIIILVLAIFYGITVLVTKNKKVENDDNDNNAVIQYDEILVGNIYSQQESEYYVLAIKDNTSTHVSSLEDYSSYDKALRSYTIDLNSGFNKKFLAGESNFEGKLPVFKTTTLLKIVNAKISEIYEDNDIKNQLDKMIESVKE